MNPRPMNRDTSDAGVHRLEVQEKLRLLELQIHTARSPADLQRALDRLTDLQGRYTLNKLELNACLSSLNSKFKILLSETKN
jgi:hypothetical protein